MKDDWSVNVDQAWGPEDVISKRKMSVGVQSFWVKADIDGYVRILKSSTTDSKFLCHPWSSILYKYDMFQPWTNLLFTVCGQWHVWLGRSACPMALMPATKPPIVFLLHVALLFCLQYLALIGNSFPLTAPSFVRQCPDLTALGKSKVIHEIILSL